MADGSDERRKRRLGGRAKTLSLAFAGAAAAAGAGLYLKGRRRTAGEESSEDEVEAHPS